MSSYVRDQRKGPYIYTANIGSAFTKHQIPDIRVVRDVTGSATSQMPVWLAHSTSGHLNGNPSQ